MPAVSSRRRPSLLAAAAVPVVLAALVLVAAGRADAATTDTLNRGQTLASGASLQSTDGRTHLDMQTDGNLVLYGPSGARWSSRTGGYPGARLKAQTDGNIVVYDTSNVARWTPRTTDVTRLVVQNDGNLVAYNASNAVRWTSNTPYPPASAGPFTSGPFTAAMQSDGNFVLSYRGSASPDVLWNSGTGGHPNAYLKIQSDGNAVIYDSGKAIWQSGTSGHPGARMAVTSDGNLLVGLNGAVYWQTKTAGAAGGLLGGSADGRFTQTWSHVLGGAGTPAVFASPGVGTLDSKGTALVFGTRAGGLNAFHASDGSRVGGWPIGTGGVAVDSTPAVVGSGTSARVYVGLGTAARPTAGGIAAYGANGAALWFVRPKQTPSGSTLVGLQSSVAAGSLQTGNDVYGGPMGQLGYAVSSAGSVLRGFPWFQSDTNFSSPALANVTGDANDEIIVGGDSTAGTAYGRNYPNGGFIRIVRNTGAPSAPNPAGATVCEYTSNQVVQSSPAVGRFLSGSGIGIVAGTGTYYSGASDTNAVIAVNTGCQLAWKATLDGPSKASPSLVDIDGNGTLEVVTASTRSDNTATVYALDGTTGRTRWSTRINGIIPGQVTSIDIGGSRSLLVASSAGVQVLDAATGRITGNLTAGIAVQNTATVTVDPGGAVGVTVIGYNGQNRGVALHYTLDGATATTVGGAGQWPMFHHDPRLRGSTLG